MTMCLHHPSRGPVSTGDAPTLLRQTMRVAPFLLFVNALSGCGDTTNTPPTDAAAPIDVAADAATDASGDSARGDGAADAPSGTATLTVRVIALQVDGTSMPSPDTQVAFDRPNGTRQELITDASGTVTFTGIDWGAGTGMLTAYRAGYMLASRANVDARSPMVELAFSALPQTVHFRGSLRGLLPGAVRNAVSTTGATGGTTTGAMFDVNAPRGAPFQLVISEGAQGAALPSGRGFAAPAPMRWSELTHAALNADAREDIDLTMTRPLMPTSFRVTYTVSAALAARLSPNPAAIAVVVTPVGGVLSTFTSTDRPRADGPFDVAAEYVRPAGVERFVTQHLIVVDVNNGGAGSSSILEDGVPAPTASINSFLAIPTLGDVPFPTTAHSTVQVRDRAPGVPVHGVIVRDGVLLWYLDIGADGTTVRFPALPTRAASDPALRGENLKFFVRSCEAAPRSFLCRRMAAAETFDLNGSL